MATPARSEVACAVSAPVITREGGRGISPGTALALTGVSLAALTLLPGCEKAAPAYTSLNMDESNGDKNIPGQTKQVADYLRTVEALGTSAKDADLGSAIAGIQQEAANAKASTFTDAREIDFRTVPEGSTWLVWVSNRDNIEQTPSDIQMPFGMPGVTFPDLHGQVMIVHAFDPRVPDRTITKLSVKEGTPVNERIWAVAVR